MIYFHKPLFRCLRHGVLKEVLRLLIFINGTLLDVHREQSEINNSIKHRESSFLIPVTPGVEEKAPFSSGTSCQLH